MIQFKPKRLILLLSCIYVSNTVAIDVTMTTTHDVTNPTPDDVTFKYNTTEGATQLSRNTPTPHELFPLREKTRRVVLLYLVPILVIIGLYGFSFFFQNKALSVKGVVFWKFFFLEFLEF